MVLMIQRKPKHLSIPQRARRRWLGIGLVAGFAVFAACGPSVRRTVDCPEGARAEMQTCVFDYEVRVNTVGYLPGRRKQATFVSEEGAFELLRTEDDEVVFEGTAEGPLESKDTLETVYVADFSEFTETGEYYLKVRGGRSPAFRIGREPLEEALRVVMLGLYGQRCGEEVTIEHDDFEFSHEACHLDEASLERLGEAGTKDDTGGWHDAGDYGKYTVNGAFAVAHLLLAFEHFEELASRVRLDIPENENDLPDILDEAKVELLWLLKVQLDDGSFAHKVTARDFEGVVLPELDGSERVFVEPSSAGTAHAVAALGLAARVFAPFDEKFSERCLEAAAAGGEWLVDHPDEVVADQAGITTGGYHSGGDGDERLWAMVELFESSGEERWLSLAEQQIRGRKADTTFDWANPKNFGLASYVRSEREGRDPEIVAAVAEAFLGIAQYHAETSARNPYGRGVDGYYWGINGALARLSLNLSTAHYVQPDAEYLDVVQSQLDHLLGRNFYGRSYVTGLGTNPVLRPHHRPSQVDSVSVPWPGLLIGGPHSNLFDAEDEPENMPTPPALTWTDEYENYLHNEVAINWMGSLAYALMAALALEPDSDGCDQCLNAGGAPSDRPAGGAGGGS